VYVTAYLEEGKHHFDRKPHLVFVLANAESHGLTRIEPEPYTCECSAKLPPEKLDAGDEGKASWPNCKSWRDGGRKRCPDCGEYPSIDREQHIRARGYRPTPKDEIRQITAKQREDTLEKTEGQCLACADEAGYVVRMVPPRYGGSRELSNLAPLCEHHYEDYGHMFADILSPPEWYKIHGAEWRELATELRDQFDEMGEDSMVTVLSQVLEANEGRDWENPFLYLDAE
jgi:hypothetical protein